MPVAHSRYSKEEI